MLECFILIPSNFFPKFSDILYGKSLWIPLLSCHASLADLSCGLILFGLLFSFTTTLFGPMWLPVIAVFIHCMIAVIRISHLTNNLNERRLLVPKNSSQTPTQPQTNTIKTNSYGMSWDGTFCNVGYYIGGCDWDL